MSFDDKQIPKCNSPDEINKFFAQHAECDLNSEHYPDDVVLIFCKTHAEYESSASYRKEGTYVFMRPPEHETDPDNEDEITKIDLYESEYVNVWFEQNMLCLRVGISIIQLDKDLAEQVLIAMNNSSDKMNEMGLKLGVFESE